MAGTDVLEAVRWMLPTVEEPVEASLLAVDYCDSTGRKLSGHSELLETLSVILHNVLVGLCVQSKGGRLVKFTGDGCLAAFLGPDSANVATGTALEFRERIAVLNTQLRNQAKIFTKCGLHRGSVYLVDYAKLLAAAKTARFTLLDGLTSTDPTFRCPEGDPHGSTVDVVFRIMSYAQRGQILASEEFLHSIKGEAGFVKSHPVCIPLKGVPDGVSVSEVYVAKDGPVGIKSVERQIDLDDAAPILNRLKELHDIAHDWLRWRDELCEASSKILGAIEESGDQGVELSSKGLRGECATVESGISTLKDTVQPDSPAHVARLLQELDGMDVAPTSEDAILFGKLNGFYTRFLAVAATVGDPSFGLRGRVSMANAGMQIRALYEVARSIHECAPCLLAFANDAIREALGMPKPTGGA